MLDPTDTIAAVASPPGGGWRGLVRVSGPGAFAAVLGPVAGAAAGSLPRPERRGARLRVDELERSVDVELKLWPGRRTYTGEPLVEVGAIGAPVILRAILAQFLRAGARLAEPGEFTLRAFLAGRIDLTQAEAVAGVIDAGSPAQLAGALRQLAGGLGDPLTRLRDDLSDTLAHLEANLDFADEGDVDPLGRARLAALLDRGAASLGELAEQFVARHRAANRARVVLVGPPNAGKSRLFNALVGADRALVAPIPGTTRDYLEAPCDLGEGLIVDLVDTAGIEAADGSITEQAQAARADQASAANLLLDCRPIGTLDPAAEAAPVDPRRLGVATKADLPLGSDRTEPTGRLATSAATGAGLVELRRAIVRAILARDHGSGGDAVAATAARCGAELHSAGEALRSASVAAAAGRGDELIAVDLRQAIDALGRVVGAVVTDDLLDRIFRRFCIGK